MSSRDRYHGPSLPASSRVRSGSGSSSDSPASSVSSVGYSGHYSGDYSASAFQTRRSRLGEQETVTKSETISRDSPSHYKFERFTSAQLDNYTATRRHVYPSAKYMSKSPSPEVTRSKAIYESATKTANRSVKEYENACKRLTKRPDTPLENLVQWQHRALVGNASSAATDTDRYFAQS